MLPTIVEEQNEFKWFELTASMEKHENLRIDRI